MSELQVKTLSAQIAGARFRRWASLISLSIALAVGVLASIMFASVNRAPGETGLAAIGLLQTGSLANPYFLPTGPTAHVSPLNGGLIAAIYAVFGINSDLSRIVLGLAACAAYLACTMMTISFCNRYRTSALVMVLLVTCLLPFTLFENVVGWRQWDQPYAALLLMAGFWICMSEPLQSPRSAIRRLPNDIVLGGLAGLACLTSPSVVPALLVGWAITLWRQIGRSGSAFRIFRSLALMVILVFPWGLRNKADLGAWIFTRSNFGLELAVGNNDTATGRSPLDERIHPHDSEAAARRVQEIGEVGYMAEMSNQASDWIVRHPGRFIALTLTRLRLILMPPPDFVGWLPLGAAWVSGLALVAFNLAKLTAIAATIIRRDRVLMWLTFCFLPLLPYAATHVGLRYLYPVFFPSLCLIATFIDQVSRRTRSAGSPQDS